MSILLIVASFGIVVFLLIYAILGGFGRTTINGPANCNCWYCEHKTFKGTYPCEYYDHHCEHCHAEEMCTNAWCQYSGWGGRKKMEQKNETV